MPSSVYTQIAGIAYDQHGLVTTADLAEAGLRPRTLVDYERRGLAERVAQGVYRLLGVPQGPMGELMAAAMWPMGLGVLSHETALDLHDLCDVNPARIDVTVPPRYRTHRLVPALYRLHRAELDAAEQTFVRGVPVVSPARAIADGIASGVRPGLIEQALRTASEQALITDDQLRTLNATATLRR
jgi:predicted transcriptional regulator of viral defense system